MGNIITRNSTILYNATMESVGTEILNGLIVSLIIFFAVIITLAIVAIGIYVLVIFIRLRKREKISLEMITLEVRLPKDNEIKIDAAEQMFSSFASLGNSGLWSFFEVDDALAFEIIGTKGKIGFYVSAPARLKDLVEKQIYAFYPSCDISLVEEPNIFHENGKVAFVALKQKNSAFNPIKTYKELPTDSLSLISSPFSKLGDDEGSIIQILIRSTKSKHRDEGRSYISSTKKKEASPEEATFRVDQKVLEKIDEKVTKPGFDVAIRLVTSAQTKEMADLHLKNLKTPFIVWVKAKTAPVSSEVPQEGGTFIGHGHYRGVRRPVHVLLEDRRRHVYIIGKTGVGKSVLLHDMAVQDIEAGHGVCVIDPHGDLVEGLLRYIPPERAEDVIYFDPSDTDRPMGLNLLEANSEEEKHFMTTGIINL